MNPSEYIRWNYFRHNSDLVGPHSRLSCLLTATEHACRCLRPLGDYFKFGPGLHQIRLCSKLSTAVNGLYGRRPLPHDT